MSESAPKTGSDATTRTEETAAQAGTESAPETTKLKIGGLGRKAQRLEAARAKAAQVKSGAKPSSRDSAASFKAKDSFAGTQEDDLSAQGGLARKRARLVSPCWACLVGQGEDPAS